MAKGAVSKPAQQFTRVSPPAGGILRSFSRKKFYVVRGRHPVFRRQRAADLDRTDLHGQLTDRFIGRQRLQFKSQLVIAGRQDNATPVAAGELIRSNIPGASMTLLDAAHISNVEQPYAFTDAVVGFLTQR